MLLLSDFSDFSDFGLNNKNTLTFQSVNIKLTIK